MVGRSGRGFAAMDPEAQREIARRGGRAAHESGNAHEFNSQEAAVAGRKGGEEVSKNRMHMAEIGRKGGLASHQRNAAFYRESAAQGETALASDSRGKRRSSHSNRLVDDDSYGQEHGGEAVH